MKPIEFIDNFLNSNDLEAFITGPAGSGKTTILDEITKHLVQKQVHFLVTAFTHKAKQVLQSKLSAVADSEICTLHSWLKKRPTINQYAKHINAIMRSRQYGKPAFLTLLIVDEFSFVGEEDYFSIGELQDELQLMDYPEFKEGKLKPLKVLYVGDLNQLSPVKGVSAIQPQEPHWMKLTKVHRTDNDLIIPLSNLVNIIEGRQKQYYLEITEHFKRKVDIVKAYKESKEVDKIILAYTNKRVQAINAAIKGRNEPIPGDMIYDSTNKCFYKIKSIHKRVDSIWTINGIINRQSDFNPLKVLDKFKEVKYYEMEEGVTIAAVFGSYNNKVLRNALATDLVNANKSGNISEAHKAYKLYKNINDYTSNIDFEYAITIHKSQGSEFNEVYVDSQDLNACINIKEKLKLLYVAISRAKKYVFLNT